MNKSQAFCYIENINKQIFRARLLSDILLRLLHPIRKNLVHIKWTLQASLDFSFLGNKLRESLHTNRASLLLALLGRAASRPYSR